MNHSVFTLFLRDLRRTMNLRTWLIWIALAGMGVFLFFASGGKTELVDNDRIEFISLFLPHMIFGARAVLSVYFDLISSDRQNKVLDCILSGGVSKSNVFLSKVLVTMTMSLVLSVIYLLPLTIVTIWIKCDIRHIVTVLSYVLPLWGYIMVYASMGLLISVIARSSKAALIFSLLAGLLLMPRLFVMIVEGAGNLFGWTAETINSVSMIAPGVMLYALAEPAGTSRFALAATVFVISILTFFTLGHMTFIRQDEWNYGE